MKLSDDRGAESDVVFDWRLGSGGFKGYGSRDHARYVLDYKASGDSLEPLYQGRVAEDYVWRFWVLGLMDLRMDGWQH